MEHHQATDTYVGQCRLAVPCAIQATHTTHTQPQATHPDDDLGVDTLLDVWLCGAEQGTSKEHNGRGAVAHLCVLRPGNVNQQLGSWVDNVQQSHDGGAIIGDCDCSLCVDELVHAPWPKRRADSLYNSLAGVDVANQLPLALASVGALTQQNDLGALQRGRRGARECVCEWMRACLLSYCLLVACLTMPICGIIPAIVELLQKSRDRCCCWSLL